MNPKSLLLLSLCSLPLVAKACDNPFGYSYLSETLAPGKVSFVQWATGRLGRDLGAGYDSGYRAVDLRSELEFGLSEREQLSAYLNYRHFDTAVRDGLRFDGVQVAYMRMLAHPDQEAWGSAIYIEPGYSQSSSKSGALRDQYSLEVKYLLQHNLGEEGQDGIYAANLVGEVERVPSTGEDALTLKLTQGVAWQVGERWQAGLEAVVGAEWAEGSDFEHFSAFVGPCARYQSEGSFFMTATALAQVAGSPTDKGELNVGDKSPWEIRLKAGFDF